MAIQKFFKELYQLDLIDDDELLLAIPNLVSEINNNYDDFISICNKCEITDESFFMQIYANSSKEVQYRLWKDGYVDSCPAELLLDDISTDNPEVVDIIGDRYEGLIPHCEAHFEGIQDIIIKYILTAKQSIKIAMAWFTNPEIFNALLKACKKGIDVTMLINNDSINNRPNGLPFNKLIENDATLYIAEPPALIHHKFCIIDERLVIDGSYNWTILAENNNDENIVVIKGGNTVDSFLKAYEELVENNTSIDHMPDYASNRPEYDCTSYKYVNSEEYGWQLSKTDNKRKRRLLSKEIYKLLPEESAKEKIPAELFDDVKQEVEDEKYHDQYLFDKSLTTITKTTQKEYERNRKEIRTASNMISKLEEEKAKESSYYKSIVETVKFKKIPQSQKDAQISQLRITHNAELTKINRAIARCRANIDNLERENSRIDAKQSLAQSLTSAEMNGSDGLCRINLKWNTSDDLDLHLILPDGALDSKEDVYYSNMKVEYEGGLCFLDHDAIPNNDNENPQENIVWKSRLPDGKYRISVKLFNKKSNKNIIPFSITVFAGDYVNTQLFDFYDADSGDVIDIVQLTFKNGKVVTPIKLNK